MDVTQDSASAHPPSSPRDLIADLVEEEIARLRKRRPGLSERLDRASNILVAHLACRRPGRTSYVVRVRLCRDGRRWFLVRSISAPGAVYAVDPNDWSCSCPDHHRRGTICKHSAACYILWRVSCGTRFCVGCRRRFVRGDLIELHEGDHDGLHHFDGDLICRECCDRTGVSR